MKPPSHKHLTLWAHKDLVNLPRCCLLMYILNLNLSLMKLFWVSGIYVDFFLVIQYPVSAGSKLQELQTMITEACWWYGQILRTEGNLLVWHHCIFFRLYYSVDWSDRGPLCVEFVCSLIVCVGFNWVLKHAFRSIVDSEIAPRCRFESIWCVRVCVCVWPKMDW